MPLEQSTISFSSSPAPSHHVCKRKARARARAFSFWFVARSTGAVFRLHLNEARFHVEAGHAVVAAEHVAPAAAVWVQQVEERPPAFAAVLELAGSSELAATRVWAPPLASAGEPVELLELAALPAQVGPGWWLVCSPVCFRVAVQVWAAAALQAVLQEPAGLPVSLRARAVPQEQVACSELVESRALSLPAFPSASVELRALQSAQVVPELLAARSAQVSLLPVWLHSVWPHSPDASPVLLH